MIKVMKIIDLTAQDELARSISIWKSEIWALRSAKALRIEAVILLGSVTTWITALVTTSCSDGELAGIVSV